MQMYIIFTLAFIVTLVYLIGSVIAIIQMPADYFIKERTSPAFKDSHILVWVFLKGLKNLIGLCLLLAGVVMLVTPGQGLLSILLGLFFMDFPGKRKMERTLIRKPSIHKSINWIREKANKPPIKTP